ncbi:carboxylesterase 3 [Menidia menidia]
MRTVLLFLCLLPVVRPQPTEGPVVSLTTGRVRGQVVSVRGSPRGVQRFLGVPYARPPIGALRLAPPLSPEPWSGERDATHHPPMCIQDPQQVVEVSRVMSISFSPPGVSEDCLYLNVYSPAGGEPGGKLPVMVWIHGGGLTMGAASQYDGAPLAAYENIVVVVIQYRLGILGFLSTGDQHARGNWGLLDQLEALRWVQQNAAAFGGDPTTVTLAGESAGGISASILTLSPKAGGLFHRVIFQSGVATLGTYTTDHPLTHAKVVANLTGCCDCSSERLVSCIRGKSQEELLNATKQLKLFLGAVVDGDLLPAPPGPLLRGGAVMPVPVMLGVTDHEFGWILPQSFAPPGWEKGMDRDSVLAVVNMFNPKGIPTANGLLTDEYLRGASGPEGVRDAFTELVGDLLMTLPVVEVAGYHAGVGAPVFLYEFVYSSALHRAHRPGFVRADHADDVGFMFGGAFWEGDTRVIGNITSEDEAFSRTMMSYWGNFVRSGSPNGPGLVRWPRYDLQKQEYMELDASPLVKQKLRKDRVHFATVVLPQRLKEMEAEAGN